MKLKTECSPHIRANDNTARIMLDVIIALIPALVAGIVIFGARVLMVVATSVAASVMSEWVLLKLTKRPGSIGDFTAVVTGLLLALALPVSVPYHVVATGAVFSIAIAKLLCGGIGKNAFNRALSGRAFVMLLFPDALVRYAVPCAVMGLGNTVDIVSSATSLHHMQIPALPSITLLDCFLGSMGGCIGEVSTLALLIGGVYLLVRRVINIRIPAGYLGSVALLTLIYGKGESPLLWMAYSLLSGGVVMAALFMATDYASSPVTPAGQWIYGIGCGVLTVVFRYNGLFPEGATYAILIMNAASRLIDRLTVPRVYGHSRGGGIKCG